MQYERCSITLKYNIILVAQTKRMTSVMQLLSRFIAASLATNQTSKYNTHMILHAIILNLDRSPDDQIAGVNIAITVHQLAIPSLSK